MKQLTALLLSLVLLLTALPALSDGVYYEAMGMTFDFDAVAGQSSNYPFLMDYGVAKRDPYLAALYVYYYDLPEEIVMDIREMIAGTDDAAEAETLSSTLDSKLTLIALIVAISADTPIEERFESPLPEGAALVKFGESDGYQYYCLTVPADDAMALFAAPDGLNENGDASGAEREKTREDIERVQAELLRQLQAAELSTPVDREAGVVGQIVRFETTDLDGNPVSSADLFKANKITMINLWGTWCVNCMNEMGELAELHKRLQEKGCGVVGVEYERQPIEEVADTARQVFADNGTTYPNVIMPKDDPIFSQMGGYPTSLFVDSAGRVLTYPIPGAAVEQYEPTIDKLLAGEAIDAAPQAGAAANDVGTYRVVVCDTEGNPIEGVLVQFCDDFTCSFEMTDADGVAVFNDREQKEWIVHLPVAPDGYAPDEGEYKTLDTFSDVNIFLEKAA